MQPTAPTPCNTCGMGCRRQARQKTATCCFGFWQQPPTRQTHSAGNCNNRSQTGNCSNHPKLHCHKRPCDAWPARLELLPESDVAHCSQLHQSPQAHQGAAPPDPTGGATPGLDAMEVGEPLLDAAAPGSRRRGVDGDASDASGTAAMYSGGWIRSLEELLNNSSLTAAGQSGRPSQIFTRPRLLR